MFDKKKKAKAKEKKEKKENPNSLPAGIENNPVIKSAKVHTMPNKFLTHLPRIKVRKKGKMVVTKSNAPKMSKGMQKNVIIAAVIAIIFLAVVALAAWFFIRSINQQPQDDLDLIIPTEQTEKEEATPPKECSANECSGCDTEQCRQLTGSCMVDIVFEPCPDDLTQECAVEKCVADTRDEIFNEDDDALLDDDFYEQDPNLDNVLLEVSQDTDSDGLTDIEEAFWGTDVLLEDTDGDSYLDGQEIYNQYNPFAGESAVMDTGFFTSYNSNQFGYSFRSPADMEIVENPDNPNSVLIKASSTQEFFNILVIDSLQYADVERWFNDTNPNVTNYIQTEIGSNKAIVSSDLLNAYVIHQDNLLIISYLPGSGDKLNFMTTFKMLINTFKFYQSPFDDNTEIDPLNEDF